MLAGSHVDWEDPVPTPEAGASWTCNVTQTSRDLLYSHTVLAVIHSTHSGMYLHAHFNR